MEVGDIFGLWRVVDRPYRNSSYVAYVPCECACGTSRCVRQYNLERGFSSQCSSQCPAAEADKLANIDPERIKTLDQWLEVFNNDSKFDPPVAACPTEAAPGSESKIETMARRLQNGEQIFHPLDRQDFTGSPAGYIQPND